MCDHHRRVSAAQLKIGEEAIKVRLKGMRYRLYTRVCASIGVYSSGNEVCELFSFGGRDGMGREDWGLMFDAGSYGKGKGIF